MPTKKMLLRVGMIPADGIGKEVLASAKRVLECIPSLSIEFIHYDAGFEYFNRHSTALPSKTIMGLKSCHSAMFGAVSSPSYRVPGYSSPIVQLRKELDLYANVRPVTSSRFSSNPIDMVIVRENTECLYIKQERMELDANGLKVAWADRKISEYASKRIAKTALDIALKRFGLKKKAKVTIVHKSNVLSSTDGLFRESCRLVASAPEYKDIVVEEQLVE